MSIAEKITESQIWKSVFRHPMPRDRLERSWAMLNQQSGLGLNQQLAGFSYAQ